MYTLVLIGASDKDQVPVNLKIYIYKYVHVCFFCCFQKKKKKIPDSVISCENEPDDVILDLCCDSLW